jgi:hypothetical protein
MTFVSPLVPLFVAALITVTRCRKTLPLRELVVVDSIIAMIIWRGLPKPSIAPWWGPLTFLLSKWPRVVPKAPQSLRHGGPLGAGCAKLVEVIVAVTLWRRIHDDWPTIALGPLPGWQVWIIMLLLSAGVNVVMYFWSKVAQSRGDHQGVHDMVESSQGRALSVKEHAQILGLAFVNGTCEEITSRWFWRREFSTYLGQSIHHSNLAQAAVFGIWHYHGIPSGWMGVGLTFVYGYIMGLLQDHGEGGLLLPVIAHTIADYYIFAIIARQKQDTKTKKES